MLLIYFNQVWRAINILLDFVITDQSKNLWKPFLDLLMEMSDNEKKFTDEELREEVDTMMIAVS